MAGLAAQDEGGVGGPELPPPPDAPLFDAALAAQIEALRMATPPPFAVPMTAPMGG